MREMMNFGTSLSLFSFTARSILPTSTVPPLFAGIVTRSLTILLLMVTRFHFYGCRLSFNLSQYGNTIIHIVQGPIYVRHSRLHNVREPIFGRVELTLSCHYASVVRVHHAQC